MINFFRKVRRNLLHEGRMSKYLLYAIGEILLVMIGILLAIKVNNINEARLNKNEAKKFYENFKRQIIEDRDIIQSTAQYNDKYRREYEYATSLIGQKERSKIDTLGLIALNLTKYSDYDRPGNIYEAIVQSGDVQLLDNRDVLEKIQILEETYTYFNRMEDIHYDLITSIVPELIEVIRYSDNRVMDAAKLMDYRFQNIFITAQGITVEKDDVYQRAIKQIDELVLLLGEEIDQLSGE